MRFTAKLFDRSLSSPLSLERDAETGRPNKDVVGRVGEDLAARWLWFGGMKVLYRNYRAPRGGEVDIVLRDGKVLVFCEVKTRTSEAFGRPIEAVTAPKQALIAKGAMAWMGLLDMPSVKFRFDVVEVMLRDGEVPELNRVAAAFDLPEPLIYG